MVATVCWTSKWWFFVDFYVSKTLQKYIRIYVCAIEMILFANGGLSDAIAQWQTGDQARVRFLAMNGDFYKCCTTISLLFNAHHCYSLMIFCDFCSSFRLDFIYLSLSLSLFIVCKMALGCIVLLEKIVLAKCDHYRPVFHWKL